MSLEPSRELFWRKRRDSYNPWTNDWTGREGLTQSPIHSPPSSPTESMMQDAKCCAMVMSVVGLHEVKHPGER